MYVDILILAHLLIRPQHGYEIKKNVGNVLGSGVTINNNLLYPALRRFEEMGAVEREIERQQGKPDRHIYRLTDLGREILHDLLREFPLDIARSDSEFLTRISFFELLDPEARLDILLTREKAQRSTLAHLAHMRALAEEDEPDNRNPYAVKVLTFLERQVRQELEWIEELKQEARGAIA